jgi:Caspase domain
MQLQIQRFDYIKAMLLVLLSLLLATSAGASYAATRNLVVQNVKAGEQKRIALVIGNSDYESQEVPKLVNPVNDARSMAETLNKLGFQVTEVTNATQKEMNRAIASFGERLNPNTVALFYFAGHGLQVKGKNYLVPIDAEISGEASIPAETVDVDTVLAQLEYSPMSIVILDACRNNPFKRARSIGGGGLAQMDAPKGSFIAYATSPGKTAEDGAGGNGLYTQALLKNIQAPGISLEEVFKRVRKDVSQATGDEQIPWESTSLTGNFYFNGSPSEGIERTFWESIKNSTIRADFDTYLTRYPKGLFVDEATKARDRLTKQELEAAAQRQAEQNRVEQEKQQLQADRQKMESEVKEQAEELAKQKKGKPAPAPYVPPAF